MSTDHLDNESFTDFEKSCPLCMELFDLDDMGFLPCPCGYRICRFCWHRLKTYEDNIEAGFEDQDGSAGRCPACRQVYSDVPAGFDSNLTALLDPNMNKKKKKRLLNKQKQKLQEEKQKLKEILKRNEKSLAGVRVVQKNLVFVIGISQRSHDDLKREFGKFGKIHKLVIGNSNNTNLNTAYITYLRAEDAIKTIQALNHGATSLNNQLLINGQSKLATQSSSTAATTASSTGITTSTTSASNTVTRPAAGVLKASLGTTKYCNHWLKNQQCPKLPDCMYLHELADQEASFTKEDMQKGKHAEYEKKLIQEYLDKNCSDKISSLEDCDTLADNDSGDNLKSSNSIENLLNENLLNENLLNENQLNHQMNLNDNEENDCCLFNNSNVPKTATTNTMIENGRAFGSTTMVSNARATESIQSAKACKQPLNHLLNQINSNQIKSSATEPQTAVTNLNGDLVNDTKYENEENRDLVFNSRDQARSAFAAMLDHFPVNNCINLSSSYLDAEQQILKINDDSHHHSINTAGHNTTNNSSTNSTTSTNGLPLFANSSNHHNTGTNSSNKSKCINIEMSRNSNSSKLRMNFDEIIANSSDSSTSYSTCSSGSNRLNTNELNEFNHNLLLNGEQLNSLNLLDHNKMNSQLISNTSQMNNSTSHHNHNHHHNNTNHKHHQNTNHNSNSTNSLLLDALDDDLDFDPISISTIGLQDLLKTSSMNTTPNSMNQNATSTTSRLFASNNTSNFSNTNSLGNSLFSGQTHQFNQMSQQLTSSLLQNQQSQQHSTKLQQTQLNPDRSNLFGLTGSHLFANSNNSINSLGSLSNSLAATNGLHHSQQQQQSAQNTNNDPNDVWRNSLRALLPNVNITFANSSSQNQSNLSNLNSNQTQISNQSTLISQQLSQQMSQTFNQTLNSQNSQQATTMNQSLNLGQNLNATLNHNLNAQQQQQQQQSFTPFSLPPGLDVERHLQQPTNHPLLAFLQHQQMIRQQTSGLNLQAAQQQAQPQFSNHFFGQHPSQLQQSSSSSQQQQQQQQQQTPVSIADHLSQNLSNLQRFFPQNFGIQEPQSHQTIQPPPGFMQ